MFSFRNFREAGIGISAMLAAALIVALGVYGMDAVHSYAFWFFVLVFLLLEVLLQYTTVAEPQDIWVPQWRLMKISDQKLPTIPTITRDSLMYFAITMEELGETGQALTSWARTPGSEYVPGVHRFFHDKNLEAAILRLRVLGADLRTSSKELRGLLEKVDPEWCRSLSKEEATELLDGVTDVAVTTAGLGLASGLPAAAAYAEVQRSNHSKANLQTGLIDKDPSGKWIKGPSYTPPDLGKVLEDQLDAVCNKWPR